MAPHLSADLAPTTALETWCHRLGDWPADGPAVLEVRLGTASPGPIDCSVRFSRPELARRLAFQLARNYPLLDGGWERLGHPEPIPHLWLELDDSAFSAPAPAEPAPAASGPPSLSPVLITRFRSRPTADWLASKWLAELSSPALAEEGAEHRALTRHLRHCLGLLPAPGRVLYGFDLAARGGAPIRLELVGLAAREMADYLERITGAGQARMLRRLLDTLEPIERPHLSFDLDPDGVAPRIGFELSFHRQPDREPGWRRVIDRLVEDGLCHPAEREALLAWPGVDHLRTALDRWPPGGRGHLVRCLSHLKLVLEPDRDTTAKAYLLFENVT